VTLARSREACVRIASSPCRSDDLVTGLFSVTWDYCLWIVKRARFPGKRPPDCSLLPSFIYDLAGTVARLIKPPRPEAFARGSIDVYNVEWDHARPSGRRRGGRRGE